MLLAVANSVRPTPEWSARSTLTCRRATHSTEWRCSGSSVLISSRCIGSDSSSATRNTTHGGPARRARIASTRSSRSTSVACRRTKPRRDALGAAGKALYLVGCEYRRVYPVVRVSRSARLHADLSKAVTGASARVRHQLEDRRDRHGLSISAWRGSSSALPDTGLRTCRTSSLVRNLQYGWEASRPATSHSGRNAGGGNRQWNAGARGRAWGGVVLARHGRRAPRSDRWLPDTNRWSRNTGGAHDATRSRSSLSVPEMRRTAGVREAVPVPAGDAARRDLLRRADEAGRERSMRAAAAGGSSGRLPSGFPPPPGVRLEQDAAQSWRRTEG
jgi:hypothetical protein